MAACIGFPIVVHVVVDLLDLVNTPVGIREDRRDRDCAHVFLLRALGEVQQSKPLDQIPTAGGHVSLHERFAFEVTFDGTWAINRLQQFLKSEILQIDLLHVPLTDSSAWQRPDFGVHRVATYRLCPWPWVYNGDLCAAKDVVHTTQAVSAEGFDFCATQLRVRLWSRVAHESPWGCGVQLPKSGDIFEVPQTQVSTNGYIPQGKQIHRGSRSRSCDPTTNK